MLDTKKLLGRLLILNLLGISPSAHAQSLATDLIQALSNADYRSAISILEKSKKPQLNPSEEMKVRSIESSQLNQLLYPFFSKKIKKEIKLNLPSLKEKTPPPAEAPEEIKMEEMGLEKVDTIGNTALLLAIDQGFDVIVEELLKRGANVNHANQYGNTPLILAFQKRNPKIVEAVMNAHPDVNPANKKGETALHWSVAWLSSEYTKRLLQLGAKIDLPTAKGETPVLLATRLGSKELLQLMVPNTDELKSIVLPQGGNLLHLSATVHNPELLRFLLEEGLDPRALDQKGRTPLMLAAERAVQKESLENLVALLSNPAATQTLEFPDPEGKTALFYSISLNSNSSIQPDLNSAFGTLLAAGANLAHQDHSGQTACDSIPFESRIAKQLKNEMILARNSMEFVEIRKRAQIDFEALRNLELANLSEEQKSAIRELPFIILLAQRQGIQLYLQNQEAKLLEVVHLTRTCAVCDKEDHLTEDQAQGPADCPCYYCEECTPYYLKSLLGQDQDQLRTCVGCKGLVRSAYLQRKGVPFSVVEQFQKRQVELGNARTPGWTPCRTESCCGGRIVLPNQEAYFDCPFCDWKGCLNCEIDHRGAECENSGKNVQATQEFLKKIITLGKLPASRVRNPEDERYYHGRFRPCYHCGVVTERSEGCNSMICRKCGYTWDWNHGIPRGHASSKHTQDYEPKFPPHL